jgi:hypothetical protein
MDETTGSSLALLGEEGSELQISTELAVRTVFVFKSGSRRQSNSI